MVGSASGLTSKLHFCGRRYTQRTDSCTYGTPLRRHTCNLQRNTFSESLLHIRGRLSGLRVGFR